jgi:hypothetical protein
VDVDVHTIHLAMLDRLAESARFREAAAATRDYVRLWTLEDLYLR